jgi:hypothetical protein
MHIMAHGTQDEERVSHSSGSASQSSQQLKDSPQQRRAAASNLHQSSGNGMDSRTHSGNWRPESHSAGHQQPPAGAHRLSVATDTESSPPTGRMYQQRMVTSSPRPSTTSSPGLSTRSSPHLSSRGSPHLSSRSSPRPSTASMPGSVVRPIQIAIEAELLLTARMRNRLDRSSQREFADNLCEKYNGVVSAEHPRMNSRGWSLAPDWDQRWCLAPSRSYRREKPPCK